MSLAHCLKLREKDIPEYERKSIHAEVYKLKAMGMGEQKATRKVVREKIAELKKERKDIEKVIRTELAERAEKVEVAKPIPEAKEAWEMSREEYAQSNLDRILEISKEQEELAKSYAAMGAEMVDPKLMTRNAKRIERLDIEKKNYSDPKWIDRTHKQAIQQAIQQGKITSHPDYPELGKVEKVKPTIEKKEYVLSVEEAERIKEAKEKPTKLTILKDKKGLLAEIDKAIEGTTGKGSVHFDIDGGANILNTKEVLGIFRKKVKGIPEGKPITVRPSILKPYPKLPRPTGKKPDISLEEEKWIAKEIAERKSLKDQIYDLEVRLAKTHEWAEKDNIRKEITDLKNLLALTRPKKKPPKPEKPAQKYLNETINYGGEIRTRGSVIAEMQKEGTPQKQIDAYMMGAKTVTKEKPLADTGGYATLKHAVIEMPEMVELVHQLMQGKLPSIKRRLRALHGMARGLFRPTGIGAIELKADIFKDSAEAAAILAHEIGHLVDWLPEKTMARGNILGRIASLKRYMKHTLPRTPWGELAALTEKDRQRLRREAAQLIKKEYADKWVDEEIRKELPITAEEVVGIWNWMDATERISKNLIDYVKGLNTPEKKSIIKEALKGQVPAQLKQFAKVVIEKTGKKIKLEPTPEELKALRRKQYEQLINQEIKKRKAFHVTEVMDELKALSREWKPFDPVADPEFTKYRYSSKELYADTFSALFNAPGLVKAKAPLFYEGFFNYLEKKPKVKELYYEIQDDIKGGAIEKRRMDGIYDMFRSGDDAYGLSLQTDVKTSDLLKRAFIDANHFVLKKVKQVGEREIAAGENPRYKLENMIYSGSEAEWYLTNVLRNVIKPLEKQNFNWDDFGVELFLRRVAGERAEMANPKGWTPELARRKLTELKGLRSERENQAVEDALKSFREVHDYVIEKGEAAGRWDPELIKVMKDTKEYATFDVIKYIEKRYGQGPAAKIYQQIGTFQEVSNPATATILKDMAIIKATNRQIAAESVVNFFLKHFPKEIRPAETRWNGKFHEIKDRSPDSKEGSIIFLKGGKAQGYYVNKYIAETFEKNPIEGNVIARILGSTVQPFKKLYVELNYGFWLFNAFFRDYQRAVKMLPKNTWFKFFPDYIRGMKPAFKSVFGIPDPVISEMQKGNMLISIADVHGLRPEDKQIEKMLRMYHITPSSWKHNLVRPFGVFFNFYTNIGRALERTTKVGSYTYLKKKFPEMSPDVMAHIVRTRGGSPDFLRKGTWNPIYNNLLIYSNAMKEGYRGDYEAFSDSPGEFMWKQAKYTYLPKLLMFAGVAGMLGYGIKAILGGASEYDKGNYILIPLGVTETGKSVYFRVPTDETSRFMGGIFWKILNHKKLGWGDLTVGLFDYMAGQAPTIHPGIDILCDIVQYCSGLNPYDAFYGRYAIPEQIREAGGPRSHKAFLRYLADKAGANIVYRFKGDSVDQIKGELEEIISYPVLSNLVGRFIKVSDYGIREDLRKAKKEARKDNTRALLDAKDAIVKVVNEEPLTDEDIKALLLKPDIFERNMILGLCRKHGMVYFDEFLRAGTTEEKAAVIKVLLEKEAFKLKVPEKDEGKVLEFKEQTSSPKPTSLLQYGEKPKKGLLAYGGE